MNKQEAIEQINYMDTLNINDKTAGQQVDMVIKNQVLDIIDQIDEPQKPVVPQFVADWIEIHKRNAPFLRYLFTNNQDEELQNWLVTDENQNSMAKAWLYGYEVEKEKLYTVEIPTHGNPNHFVLRKHLDGRVCLDCYRSDNWRDYEFSQLTEAEIKREHDWAWKYSEEVKEC